ncbi:Uncharacterised protein [Salmonella sp. NCTC 11881]|nr:Uncharacterised protein [Salmonella sp. NCTC 11881]
MIGLTFLFGLLRQFGIFCCKLCLQRGQTRFGLGFGFLLFALKDGNVAVERNQSLLLSFQFGLALYFLLRLTFQLLFQRQHFLVIKILAVFWQNKHRHREIVIFGHQPVVPDAEAEPEPQAHLGIVQIVMKFVDGQVTDTAQLMENRKDAVINKRNLAQFAQQVMLVFAGRYIQQLAEMFRGGFAKHAHFLSEWY